ncbi:MAG TPA: CAP domain-containing protein [Sunxiuqinia sp.]|nr:CAP domain-containing protein [Sunxiuqinia sp.]
MMPTIFNLLLLFSLFIVKPSASDPQDWPQGLNTTKDAFYLNQYEKEVVLELNKVRNNPAQYASEYLEPLRLAYDGKKFTYPGHIPMMTREGVAALDNCIKALKAASPAPPLTPSRGLSNAANLLVNDQKLHGGTGHVTKSGWNPEVRIRRYGTYKTHLAENIVYGYNNPRHAVISLLIDDGVPNRAHRRNILNPEFKEVGLAFEKHPKYNYVCAIEFVDQFIKK